MAVCSVRPGREERKLVAPLLGKDGAFRWILYFALPDVGERAKSMDFLSGITPPLR